MPGRFGLMLTLAFSMLAVGVFGAGNKTGGNDSKFKAPEKAVRAWRDFGFEIFVHWSAGTVFQGRCQSNGKPPKEFNRDLWGEWIRMRGGISQKTYDAALKGWNPKDFDSETWADIIASSGAKLCVYVCKHHDGFAQFKSKANNFNTHDWGVFHTDVFGKFSAALHKRGIKTGFYYSHGKDWRHNTKEGKKGAPSPEEREYFQKIVYTHLKELINNYGPQYVAWFDLGAQREFAEKCIKTLRAVNPNIMISSRVGGGLGDFSTGGDAYIPVTTQDKPWETCMTFCYHWAWYPEDRKYKTPVDVIRMLAEVRSKGGNLLLNVGPDVRGKIVLPEKACLEKVGEWLKLNGDAIYAVRPSPYPAGLPWGFCTSKKGKLFLHLFHLPTLDYVFVPGVKTKITKAYVLADPKKTPLKIESGEYGTKVCLYDAPAKALDFRDTVVVLEHDGALKVDATPVLDGDFDTVLLPQLVSEKDSKLKVDNGLRLTPVIDHPGVQEPRYIKYAYGFGNGAKAVWKVGNPEDNYFYVVIRYANLTGETLKAVLTVDGHKRTVELPPTLLPGREWNALKTLPVSKPLAITKGKGHTVSFELTEGSRKALAAASGSPGGKGKRGRRKGFKAKFALESVAFKAVYPPFYNGYGKNPIKTKFEPNKE